MLYLARKSKEEIMEASYHLYEQCNWDLTKFKNDTDLFIDDLRKNAREYAKNVLNESLTKEQVWCLMPRNIKVLFNEYDGIIKEMIKKDFINRSQLMDIDWMMENLRVLLCEYCYNISKELKWINSDMIRYCEEHKVSNTTLNNLAREYTLKVLKLDEQQLEQQRLKKEQYRRNYDFNNKLEGIYANFFMDILKIKNNDELIKKFISFNKKYFELKHNLTNFVSTYHISDEMKKDLFDKLEIYQDYIMENRDKIKGEQEDNYIKNNLDNAIPIITNYINGEYENIDKYCTEINLERNIFDKYLDLVKNNNEQLYNNYLQHIEDNKNKKYKDLLSRALIVIDLMKNGVVENGVRREFDLIDYYRYLPVGFDRMLKVVRDGINLDDYKMLSTYVSKFKNDKELSESEIDNIYNIKTIVDVKFDEEKKVIPGSGREITLTEKQNIVRYLENNNLPITNSTYNTIYRNWLSGDLVLEEEKDKKK